MEHFDLVRVIGRGSYAKVLMVELKETKRLYAMKVIKKELVTDDEVTQKLITLYGSFMYTYLLLNNVGDFYFYFYCFLSKLINHFI